MSPNLTNPRLLVCLIAAAVTGIGALIHIEARSSTELPSASSETVDPETASQSPARARIQEPADAAEARRGFYHAAAGSRFLFGVDTHARTSIASAQHAGAQRIAQDVKGRMEVVVVTRDSDELVVSVRFLEASPTLGIGRPVPPGWSSNMASELGHRAWCHLRSDGLVSGFRFDPRTTAVARSLVRALVLGHLFVIPAGAGASWQVVENDAAGAVEVAYRRLAADGRLERRKIRYLEPVDAERGLVAPQTSGVATGHANAEIGWMDRIEIRESYAKAIEPAGLEVTGSFDADLELLEHDMLPRAELALLEPLAAAGAWDPVHGSAGEIAAGADRAEEAGWRGAVGRATVAELVEELLRAIEREATDRGAVMDAQLALIWKLRLDAAALDEVARLVRGGQLPRRACGVIVAGLGAVQTEAAQSLLAAMVGDASLALATRVGSIMSMVQIAEPSAQAVAAIRRASSDTSAAADVRSAAQLMLGTFASRQPADASLMQELLRQERLASSPQDVSSWLRAIGNSESPAALGAASRYLGHANPEVRASAVLALRSSTDAGARAALAHRLDADPEPRVRAAAASVLAGSRDEGSRNAVSRLMLRRNRNDDAVRLAVVERLGERRDDFATRLLEDAARQDPSPRVRETARRALEDTARRG